MLRFYGPMGRLNANDPSSVEQSVFGENICYGAAFHNLQKKMALNPRIET